MCGWCKGPCGEGEFHEDCAKEARLEGLLDGDFDRENGDLDDWE